MPPTAPFPPASNERTARHWTVAAAVICVFVLAIALVGSLTFLRVRYGSLAAAWSSVFMPHELSGAILVGMDEKGNTIAYRYSRGSYASVPVPATMSSLAVAGSHMATLAQRPGFFQLSLDGSVVRESTSTLAYVSVSPDGAWVGASESAMLAATSTGMVTEPLIVRDARDWHVVLFSKMRPKVTVAVGSSPVFATSMLVWLDPRGIVGMKLSEGIERVLVESTSTSLAAPLVASPDGTHVALRDGRAHKIFVYRISEERAVLEGQVPDKSAPSFTLGNDAVYLIRVNPAAGTEIWKESFDGNARRVATIPASLRITRILLPSP